MNSNWKPAVNKRTKAQKKRSIDEIDSFPEWVFSALDIDLKPLGFKSLDNAVYIVYNEA